MAANSVQIPSIGRIVRYLVGDLDEAHWGNGDVKAGTELAAMITGIADDGRVHLAVFAPTREPVVTLMYREQRPLDGGPIYDSAGNDTVKLGVWFWPPRA